jgi:hypothetical protein
VASTRNTTTSKPRPAARAASRPARPDDSFDEPDTSPVDAQETEADGHYVTAELCGEELRIVPPAAWRLSWQRLLNSGQVDAFAEFVLHPDAVDLFVELDPTVEDFGAFVSDAAQQAGESLGKSRGPAPSSRRTRRR